MMTILQMYCAYLFDPTLHNIINPGLSADPPSPILAVAALQPDSITYSTLVSVFEKSGRWDVIEEVLEQMHHAGHFAAQVSDCCIFGGFGFDAKQYVA